MFTRPPTDTAGKFLYDNYVQALRNIASITEQLQDAMQVLKIDNISCFERWWLEERAYLDSLKHEPQGDVLKMEYLETLQKLKSVE